MRRSRGRARGHEDLRLPRAVGHGASIRERMDKRDRALGVHIQRRVGNRHHNLRHVWYFSILVALVKEVSPFTTGASWVTQAETEIGDGSVVSDGRRVYRARCCLVFGCHRTRYR